MLAASLASLCGLPSELSPAKKSDSVCENYSFVKGPNVGECQAPKHPLEEINMHSSNRKNISWTEIHACH